MKRKYTLSILLLVLVILAAGIIAAGSLLYRNQREGCRREKGHELEAVADLKVSQISMWRRERLEDAAVFYQNNAFSALVRRLAERPDDSAVQEEIRTWIGRLQASYHYDHVSLLDAACKEWISVPDEKAPHSTATLAAARQSMQSGKITFADFYPDETTGKVYLRIFVPILAGPSDGTMPGRSLGVLRLRIDPEGDLYRWLQRWPTPSETAETLLLSREGDEAVYLNELRFRKNTPLTLRVRLTSADRVTVKAALGQEGLLEGIDYRGVPVLAAIHAVPNSPWFLVGKMDQAEVYAPMRARLWLIILFVATVLSALAAAVGLFWQWRHVALYRKKHESEAMLSCILNSIPYSIFWKDCNSVYLGCNEVFARKAGLSPAEIVGKTDFDLPLGSREEAEAYRGHDREVITSGRAKMHIIEPQHQADGSWIWLDTTKIPLFDSKGQIDRVLGIYEDITQRKLTEEKLREREEWYRTLFVEALDGICLVDAQTGVIIDCNYALMALVGRDKAELVGQPQTILHPSVAEDERFSPTFRQHQGDKVGEILETQVVSSTGELKAVAIRARVLDSSGRKVMQGLFRDITAQKRAEQTQRQLMALIEATPDFVGFASAKNKQLLYINKAGRQMVGIGRDEDVTRLKILDCHPQRLHRLIATEILDTAVRDGVWTGECAFRNRSHPGGCFSEN